MKITGVVAWFLKSKQYTGQKQMNNKNTMKQIQVILKTCSYSSYNSIEYDQKQ